MVKKIITILMFICLLFHTNALAENSRQIEIFDNSQSKVIKTIPVSISTQKEVKQMINQINGLVKKLNPLPKNGYMIKVPLDEPVKVDTQWYTGELTEVIIVLPEDGEYYFLLLDEKGNPYFLTFNWDITAFLDEISFQSIN